jgi:multiple sugar transport system substrate-binding protein
VIPWFAGYRMRFFAAQDLLGDITDVWEAGLNANLTEAFKVASTGDDGKQYFVPWTYYNWGIFYRKSLFEENGWTAPTTMEELATLATAMQGMNITPFAFGNDGRWPAMGTFDQLNFRLNGYQFHVDLMAGKESWTDDRVKAVFAAWTDLLPLHQENPNGRTWEEAAASLGEQGGRHDDARLLRGRGVPAGGARRPRLLRLARDEPGARHQHRWRRRSTAG